MKHRINNQIRWKQRNSVSMNSYLCQSPVKANGSFQNNIAWIELYGKDHNACCSFLSQIANADKVYGGIMQKLKLWGGLGAFEKEKLGTTRRDNVKSIRNHKKYHEKKIFDPGLAFTLPQRQEISILKDNNYKTAQVLHFLPLTINLCGSLPWDTTEGSSLVNSRKEQLLQLSWRWEHDKNHESSCFEVLSQGQMGLGEKFFFCGPIEKGEKRCGRRAGITAEELLLCNGIVAFVLVLQIWRMGFGIYWEMLY